MVILILLHYLEKPALVIKVEEEIHQIEEGEVVEDKDWNNQRRTPAASPPLFQRTPGASPPLLQKSPEWEIPAPEKHTIVTGAPHTEEIYADTEITVESAAKKGWEESLKTPDLWDISELRKAFKVLNHIWSLEKEKDKTIRVWGRVSDTYHIDSNYLERAEKIILTQHLQVLQKNFVDHHINIDFTEKGLWTVTRTYWNIQ